MIVSTLNILKTTEFIVENDLNGDFVPCKFYLKKKKRIERMRRVQRSSSGFKLAFGTP